jgi:hypothetical protein
MQSYIAKTTINFVDFEFYVRPGDLLVHDSANHNRMTVYRNGQIIKVVKQGPLAMVAFLKNKFIEEVATAASHTVGVPKATPATVVAPVSPVEPFKPITKKAAPVEVVTPHVKSRIPKDEPVMIEK